MARYDAEGSSIRQLLRQGISRALLLPLLVGLALTISGFLLGEARRYKSRELAEQIQLRQDRVRDLDGLIHVCVEAENAVRGYLLTSDTRYAEPYDEARTSARQIAANLIQSFSMLDPEELPLLQDTQHRIHEKFAHMDEIWRLMQAGQAQEALAASDTDIGSHQVREIRSELESVRSRELVRRAESQSNWLRSIEMATWINLATMVFTQTLLILVGFLATSELRRRKETNDRLDQLVRERTADLEGLSSHMLRMGEFEKAALARELHDELGGLLVAMRMDLAKLRRRIVLPDEDAVTRWKRVNDALVSGVELKRRIIEELRPTLLDNLGLIAAVRWQAEESTAIGRIRLEVSLPDEEPVVQSDTAIAIFRCVQEALSNILNHAQATRVKLSMELTMDRLNVEIEDDGVGLPPQADRKPGSHGLKQMVFRMRAVGGEIRFASALPHGTCTILSVPIQGQR